MDEELKAIVQRMIDAGEPESNIKKVIQEYKPEVKKKDLSQISSQSQVETRLPLTEMQELESLSAQSSLDSSIPVPTDPISSTEDITATTEAPQEPVVAETPLMLQKPTEEPVDTFAPQIEPIDQVISGVQERVKQRQEINKAKADKIAADNPEFFQKPTSPISEQDLKDEGLIPHSESTVVQKPIVDIEKPRTPIEEQNNYLEVFLPTVKKRVRAEREIFETEREKTKKEGKEFDELVKQANGSVAGAYWNEFVEGATGTMSSTAENALRLGEYFFPNPLPTLPGEENKMNAVFSNKIKSVLQEQLKDKETNQAFIDVLKKKSSLHSGALGLTRSSYAMFTPGMTGFLMDGMNNGYHEITESNPDIDPDVAMTYGAVQGIVSMALERVGFSKVMKGNPQLKGFINKAVLDLMGKASSEFVEKGVKVTSNKLVDLATEVANGYLAEFQTGALQYAGEEAVKQASDAILGEDNFENKIKSWSDLESIEAFIGETVRAGHEEAIGGGIMGGIKGSYNAVVTPSNKKKVKEKISKIEDLEKELNNDKVSEETKDLIADNIKEVSGEVLETVKEDAEVISSLDEDSKSKIENISSSINDKKKIIEDKNVSEDTRETIVKQVDDLAKQSDDIINEAKKNIGKQTEIDFKEDVDLDKVAPKESEVKTEEKVDTDPVKTEEVKDIKESDAESLSKGKIEVESLKEGAKEIETPFIISKGLTGKKDLEGNAINVHPNVKGVFATTSEDTAKEFAGDKDISQIEIPKGTKIEVVEIDGKGMTPSAFRDAETEAINNSDADIVKLLTIDGKIKAGEKKQEQYIIKNENLIKDISGPKTEIKDKFKKAADTIRKAKFTKSISDLDKLQSSPLGAVQAIYDGAIEVVATSIETAGDIAQAIDAGISHVKSSDWYKNLSPEGKSNAEKIIRKDLEDSLKTEEVKSEKESTQPKEIKEKPVAKTVTKRFVESTNMSEEQANKVSQISKKEVTTDEGRRKIAKDIIKEVGVDNAYTLVSDPKNSKQFRPETKNYISTAKASELAKQASKEGISIEEKSRLLDQAAAIMVEPARDAERAGQISQFWNAIYKDFPEMQTKTLVIDSMRAKINKVMESQSDTAGKSVSEEIESIKVELEKEIRKQIEKEVSGLKEEIEKLKDKRSGKTRKEKGRKQVDEAKAELKRLLKGGKGTTAGATIIPGLSPDMVKAIAKLVEGYVNLGVGSVKGIINKAKTDLDEVGIEASKEDIEKIAKDNEDIKQMLKEETIREGVKDSDIKDILADYFISNERGKEATKKMLAEKLGLSNAEASDLMKSIESSLESRIQEVAKKELDKNLEVKEPLSKEDKAENRKKTRENSKTINKITKSIMLGSLSGTEFRNAFAEKYGFPEITQAELIELEHLINEAGRFEGEGKRELHQKTQRIINTKLRNMRPKDAKFYSDLIMELAYTNALSGINTQGNAGSGAIFTGSFHAIGVALEQLLRGRPGAVVYGVRAAGKSLKAASASAKEARRFNFSKFSDHNAYLEGATDREMGIIEEEVIKGSLDYFRKVSKDKTISENSKEIYKGVRNGLLQYARTSFLLNSQDAFLTTQFTEFNNAIAEYNKALDGTQTKGILKSIVNRKDLIKTLDEKMGYSSKESIENQVDKEIKEEDSRIKDEVEAMGLSDKESLREIKRIKNRTISKGYKARRVQELLTQKRDQEIYQNAVKTSRDWIMLSDPDGVFGLANEGLKWVTDTSNRTTEAGKTKATQVLAVFTGLTIMFGRMTAKTANVVMTNIPVVGLIPSTVGFSKNKNGEWNFGFKWKTDPLLFKRRLVANALMTATAAGLFAHMFKHDEEEDEYVLDPDRLIDITVGGFGGTNSEKNRQSLKNYSGYGVAWSTRNSSDEDFGPYRTAKYLPQALPTFAVIGNYSDRVRGLGSDKKLDKFNEQDGVWKLINGPSLSVALSQMLEGSFNSIGRATKKISTTDSETALEGFGIATFDLMTQPAKTITQPNFYRDLINESGIRGDKKKKYPKDLTDRLKYDYYGLDSESENKTDMFGLEYSNQSKLSQWVDGSINPNYEHKGWKILHKYPEVTLTSYRVKEEINYKGKSYKIKEENISKELQETQKRILREKVLSSYDRLNSLSPEKLQTKLNSIRNRSIDKAKREILRKYKYTKGALEVRK